MDWTLVLWLGGAVGGLFLLDQVGLWAERKRWIYWRKQRAHVSASGAMAALAEAFQPNQHHFVAEQAQKRDARLAAWSGSGVELDADGLPPRQQPTKQ